MLQYMIYLALLTTLSRFILVRLRVFP